MSLVVVGTNHKYSPITLREKLSFPKKRLKNALNFLKEAEIFSGAVILSTCNRVEIYASVENSEAGAREIENFISRYYELDKSRLSPYLYIYKGDEALRHLFSVACGLDSLIIGETQILGQVKYGFLESIKADFTDGFLRNIFYSAISFARRIHRDTRISEGKVSIGSVAIDFIKEKTGNLADKNILIIGVGKVTELVLKYLKKENPNIVFISNRTFEKANNLAGRIGARAARFDKLKEYLEEADIAITATASPHFIIKKETLRGVIDHNLLIIDLALPRDVDPEAKNIKNIELFGLEDLDTVIKKNMERKVEEKEKAESLIDIEVQRLWKKYIGSAQEKALLP